jgi:hypothetical protein
METSDILSLVAILVSIVTGIANYLYTRRVFAATNFPKLHFSLTSVPAGEPFLLTDYQTFIKASPKLRITTTNLHSNIPILNVQITIEIAKKARGVFRGNTSKFFVKIEKIEPQHYTYTFFSAKEIADIRPDLLQRRGVHRDNFAPYVLRKLRKLMLEMGLAEQKLEGGSDEELWRLLEQSNTEFEEDLKQWPENLLYFQVKSAQAFELRVSASYSPGFVGSRRIFTSQRFRVKPSYSKRFEIPPVVDYGLLPDDVFEKAFILPDEIEGWQIG